MTLEDCRTGSYLDVIDGTPWKERRMIETLTFWAKTAWEVLRDLAILFALGLAILIGVG
jgi:hypothetical protein